MVTLQVAGRTETGAAVDWNRSLEFILGEGEVIQGQLAPFKYLNICHCCFGKDWDPHSIYGN